MSAAELMRRGTYRKDRHGARVDAPAPTLCTKPRPRPKAKCGNPRKWVRGPADELAIANGCWFDERLAAYVVDWFAKYLRHSKGRWAGEPFTLIDWQREDIVYPLFGWLREDRTRRYRRTYIEIAKKQGKSTLASGIGLYMLAGDGEEGAEVFSCATDREQAGIVHGEAINMVKASPELSAALHINQSTRNILYEDKRAFYRALASTPAGREGLNGNCCIVDELHAWTGDELWNALKYMGRARTAPLQFVITTAGDDMESVCRKQHEYAKAVIAGDFPDDRFFGYIRGLEQGEDYTTHEARVKANPSLGVTINEADLIADVAEAERSPSSLAAMLRYSFNVWSTSSNPWLRLDSWAACVDSYNADSLAGQPCYAGLDLAKSHDMTACVLLFPTDNGYRQLPHFWMPEATAKDLARIAPYQLWRDRGFLTLTPGEVCDYAVVEADILAMAQRFDIQELAFDTYNAANVVQNLSNAGMTCVPFPQTIVQFAGPTAEYERLVLDGKMRHNAHPVLTWQAGHVQVLTDANRNKRPVKPKRGDHRTIDGIVASIMALGRAMVRPVVANPYETRGVQYL